LGKDEREMRAAEVETFYTKSPFPGYAPDDDGPAILDRCRRNPFTESLHRAIGPDADVLDIGTGTAQIPAYLALAGPRRRVVGVDGCRMSLTHAEEFRARAKLDNLQLVRADIFDLPIEPGSFPIVLSRGVVHHTPDPDLAIAKVAACVAPGGVLVLGYYETMGRAFHCFRRGLGKLVGKPIRALDPVLRRRDLDEEKKRIWIDDQYHHPLEHILPTPHVIDVLAELGFRSERTVPPAATGATLFDPSTIPGPAGLFARRFGWMVTGLNNADAGLVCVVARRRS
jgi:SAM-dependent methyltransferase